MVALVRHRRAKGAATARRGLTLRLPGSTLPVQSSFWRLDEACDTLDLFSASEHML